LREENEALKEDKERLEYVVFDLIKLGNLNKVKLKRIREIFMSGERNVGM
jgi:hypothetical protein